MGNCFGKTSSSSSKTFESSGRTLGSTAPAQAPVANEAKPKPVPTNWPESPSPGRVLGGNTDTSQDPKTAAALAAERRAMAGRRKSSLGLGQKLAAQRSRTQTATLGEIASLNQAQRDADATAKAQAYN